MKSCPEGAYTLGHLWMAGLGCFILAVVVTAILRNLGLLHNPPPEG